MKTKISFIGAGAMGESLIEGWLKDKNILPSQITVTNKSNDGRLVQLKDKYGIKVTRDGKELISSEPTILILACKPKDWLQALTPYFSHLNENTALVSVMAGVTLAAMEEAVAPLPIQAVRTMPNTSARVRESMTAISYGSFVKEDTKTDIETMFQDVGEIAVVPEEQMDAMTALVGTGPAYIYYLMEAMELAAVEMGIEYPLARNLVAQTLRGASTRIQQSERRPAELYKQVMSPGGTTEAGFRVLQNRDVQDAIVSCILRAWERSVELGGQPVEPSVKK